MKNKLLGYYNYTIILTYIGMLVGFTGITCVMGQDYVHAIICLMIAGVCDMFDGAIASTMERSQQEKFFGIQIDSLSDLICFGVLPAIFVYGFCEGKGVSFVFAGLYVLCALIRLAYFNVDEQERQLVSSEGRKVYLGLPVTVSAIIYPFVFELCSIFDWPSKSILLITMLAMSILFITPFKLKKPAMLGKCLVLVCGIVELLLLFVVLGEM